MAKAGAIKAVIAAQFDDSGLKKAQKEFGKLGSTIKGALGAVGIGVGLSSIVSALQASTVAAIEDTKSQALLANQLRNTVGASESQIASVEASISAMQKQAAVADDEIRPAFANLVRATGDVTRATELTNLALDVAAGTGKDLGTVSLALGKAVNGSTTSLLKLVPSIKGASDPMAVLAQQFAGASDAAAKNDPIKRLNILFGEMQEQIGTALLPSLERFSDWMSGPSGTQLINGLVASFENIVSQATLAGDGIAYIGKQASDAFGDTEISDNAAAVAGNILAIGGNAARAANPLGALLKYLQLLGIIANATKPSSAGTDETDRLIRRRLESLGAIKPTDLTPDKPTTKKAVTDYVKEFGTNLADELRKQMAKVRLGNKGLSEGLIESIIGSGAGWYTVYQSIITQSDTALGRLQQNFNKTAAGLAEIASAAEEAAKKTQEANDALIASLTDTYNKAQAEFDKFAEDAAPSVIDIYKSAKADFDALKASSDDFAKGIKATTDGLLEMTKIAEPIGQFESQVVSSFQNIESSLQNALNTKLITASAYADLSAWAKREMALMTDIARQRDALAKKISLAEGVYNDAKQSIMAYGNINAALKSTSQTITETQTKMVDGFSVSITKSVEQVSQNNLVEQYRSILAKTKEFAANLNTLKKMGLNKDLFKQIVDAGVESGGAVAAGIIAGGQQGVTELNGVFGELQAVGDQVGETTAVVMFNNGVDVMGGFINGMKAQADALAATAQSLAATFAQEFADKLQAAMQDAIKKAGEALAKALGDMLAARDKAAADLAAANAALKKAVDGGVPPPPVVDNFDDTVLVGRGAGGLGFKGGASVVDGGSKNFYVTVTNPDPNAVVDALKRYTKQNGNILI